MTKKKDEKEKKGAAQRADAVVQGDAGVRVGTGVEYDAVEGESHLLHLVDHLTLYVALKVFQFHFFVASLQL